jgi:outer membrane biosynthesis protein TonB
LFLLLVCLPVFAAEVTQPPTGARKIVHQVAPSYPLLAKKTHTFGAVKLNVAVDPNGAPKAIEVVGGNPVLVKAAQESVNRWKWAPASTETTERIELRFQPD